MIESHGYEHGSARNLKIALFSFLPVLFRSQNLTILMNFLKLLDGFG